MPTAYRASIVHCLGDPGESGDSARYEYFVDGALVVDAGRVVAVGDATEVLGGRQDVEVVDHRGKLLMPGFIDCHVHFPQVDVIASYGDQLLEWLEDYAYPGEARYADADYARSAAEFFLDELLANGTTTAAVFATVHAHSAEALFEAASTRRMRLVAGKVLMDRNCPENLRDDAESAYADSKRLIERWHGNGRLGYAITPRFALTSTEAQLAAAGRLAGEHPDTWVHTHLAENDNEIAEVRKLYPWSPSYLDVYDHFGLLRERSLFAHCLHLGDADRRQLHEKRCSVAFCPTSNTFLGSGLFDLASMRDAQVRVGLATDVGGGTSLSMLRTMAEAYKVLQLGGQSLPASRALFLSTLGAAEALGLDRHIGNFLPGKEADFVVADPAATAIGARRDTQLETIEERLFALLTLGDDRHIVATYVDGRRVSG
ncbi:MAG: guanine deaminase [Woeseiaceae bacterium]|nr:guanine deaminase [Woeseiaceae bacterium]